MRYSNIDDKLSFLSVNHQTLSYLLEEVIYVNSICSLKHYYLDAINFERRVMLIRG